MISYEALEAENWKNANKYVSSGSLESMGQCLCRNGFPVNFIISGNTYMEGKYAPVKYLLSNMYKEMPVVILHNGNEVIKDIAISSFEGNVCNITSANKDFEPFFGMNEAKVATILKNLANKMGYIAAPKLQKIIRAHIRILELLNIPVSLTGLYYLCQFHNMNEFYENIMELPCEQRVAEGIWSDLCISQDSENDQFELFRAVINELAFEAEENGWSYDGEITGINCIETIYGNGKMLLEINNSHSDLFLEYIAEELKLISDRQYLLIFDGIHIDEGSLLTFIQRDNRRCICGIITDNAAGCFGESEEEFKKVIERMQFMIMFSHGSNNAAVALSEAIGKYDCRKMIQGVSVNKGYYNIFNKDSGKNYSIIEENLYRVMPEEILGLNSEQAIIFNMIEDEVIVFN